MQIIQTTIHFSPAFNSIAINDAKYRPNRALPFQLLSEKKGGGRVMALSDAAAIHKMVYKRLLLPQVLFTRPKCAHVHGKPEAFICWKSIYVSC